MEKKREIGFNVSRNATESDISWAAAHYINTRVRGKNEFTTSGDNIRFLTTVVSLWNYSALLINSRIKFHKFDLRTKSQEPIWTLQQHLLAVISSQSNFNLTLSEDNVRLQQFFVQKFPPQSSGKETLSGETQRRNFVLKRLYVWNVPTWFDSLRLLKLHINFR